MMKLWGGRFKGEIDRSFLEFSASINFDFRLIEQDVKCTRAWSEALSTAGIISGKELKRISSGLDKVLREARSEQFELMDGDEDIHTAVERRLVELVGPEGGKIRTGRSRNDQVATDMRLYTMEQMRIIESQLCGLLDALLGKAEECIQVVVPGHTHLQQAQPVLLSHLLLAFAQMFERDRARIGHVFESADSMPLGSGALAGTGIEIDRKKLADELGFTRISGNSIDAVSDRDFVSDALYALSIIMVHLSRLSEQIILWCSQEFGMAELDDAWATGSSIMPQKKNPDAAELVRGKSGRVFGELISVLTMMKGLPLSYNRDLQEDKEGLFDSVDTVCGCLHVMERTVATIEFDRERAGQLVSGGFITSTDLADYLVGKGMEFPKAHRLAGEIVVYCLDEGKDLSRLGIEEFKKFAEAIEEDIADWLNVEASLGRRNIVGGTGPDEVARSIKVVRKSIKSSAIPL